ncbi:MAG: 3',5'-cyclic-nucleotide phosphodiesterase [Thermodesulfovibrionales bacterium]
MKVRVLGSSGAESPGYNSPAFLVDGKILLDGGTIGSSLTEREQWRIRDILITHAHLDHIKAIPFLADNIIIRRKKNGVSLFGTAATLATLRHHLLNNLLWPDFTKISASIDPVLKLRNIASGRPFTVNGFLVTAFPVNHTVDAVGYLVRNRAGRTLLYTGDTGPTDKIWKSCGRLNGLIIEVSFPNSMEDLALKTGHMTARLLGREVQKMAAVPERILITHPKPQYINRIRSEIAALSLRQNLRIEMLRDGEIYRV